MSDTETTPLARARATAGMSQTEVVAKLRAIRKRRGQMPPKDSSLKRMYVDWERGRVDPVEWRDELAEVFQLPVSALGLVEVESAPMSLDTGPTLEVSRIDPDLIGMLEAQTDHFRLMDRKVGAAIIPQTVAHVEYMQQMLRNALPGKHFSSAAVALAEGAALAGWQSLDAGKVTEAWNLHDIARTAARQGDDPASLAHVTAQQAYALLDAGRASEAVELVQYVNTPDALGKVPPRLRAWLTAVEAEFLAAAGEGDRSRRLLDDAAEILPSGDVDPELPYLMLNQTHLARWRGHCLARLGASEAVDDLTSALDGDRALNSQRAETSLRTDLALALRQRGDVAVAKEHAQRALDLAGKTGSVRQRTRITQLLTD